MCILYRVKSKDVTGIVNRLQASLKSMQVKDYTIEFSVGCVQYNQKVHQSLEDMLALADSKCMLLKRVSKTFL